MSTCTQKVSPATTPPPSDTTPDRRMPSTRSSYQGPCWGLRIPPCRVALEHTTLLKLHHPLWSTTTPSNPKENIVWCPSHLCRHKLHSNGVLPTVENGLDWCHPKCGEARDIEASGACKLIFSLGCFQYLYCSCDFNPLNPHLQEPGMCYVEAIYLLSGLLKANPSSHAQFLWSSLPVST